MTNHKYDNGEDPYLLAWAETSYLEQYYTTEQISSDEQAVSKYTIEILNRYFGNRKVSVCLEFGCGPTIHHASLMVPYTEELHLAEYLPKNLQAVQSWIDDSPNAHNWDIYLEGELDIENQILNKTENLVNRKGLLKRKITQLYTADIHKVEPLDRDIKYPLVASYYCLECASDSVEQWERNMQNLSNLIQPEGVLILSALRNATSYRASQNGHFPAVSINEEDMLRVFKKLPFDLGSIDISIAKDLEWGEEGFDSIILASAKKNI
ncbi:hypothetical protein BH09PAT2_BH09PAT2_08580 [soil metagenome]